MMNDRKTYRGLYGTMLDRSKTILGLVGVGTLLMLAACGSAQADGTEDASASEQFVRVINVEISPIEAETFIEEIRLTSVAMASQDVMLEAEENGRIIELFADRGDTVRKGAPIAKIDDAILRAQVGQARARTCVPQTRPTLPADVWLPNPSPSSRWRRFGW